MQTMNLKIGSYGVGPLTRLSAYEDECVGSSPQSLEGFVVSRIEGQQVFVKDWNISSHFEGEHALEQFEEAKNNQDFDFRFSNERELQEHEHLNGADPLLGEQLLKKLKSEQQPENVLDKMRQLMRIYE